MRTALLQTTKQGEPTRFAVRCEYSDKDTIKRAGLGTARWSTKINAWTVPPDPVILKRILQLFPDMMVDPLLQDYIDTLYAKQEAIYTSTEGGEPLPTGKDLYPFQNQTVRVLETAGSMILGHSMGLGKTVIACAAVDYLATKRVIIVCPSSVKWSWVEHMMEWGNRKDIYVLESKKTLSEHATVVYKKRDEFLLGLFADEARFVLLMSYDMLRIHKELIAKYDHDVIIFDEAHRLKNRDALTTQAAMEVCKSVARRWMLTGTPVRNHYTDLFTLLSMVDPVRFSGYWNFVNTYLDTVPNFFGGIDIVGLKNEEEFNSMLSVYMYRLTKEEVAPDLPPKIYNDMKIPMLAGQLSVYQEMEKEAMVSFEHFLASGKTVEEIVSAPNTIAQLIRLRQICLSPALIGGKPVSAKLDVLRELIQDICEQDEQVIVFSCFKQFILLVAQMCDSINIPYGLIVGGVSSKNRYEIQQALTEGRIPVVLGTTQSMGEAMNMQAARNAIFCDIDWVPAVNLQAEDRIHRGKITESPNIIRLIHPNTVEVDIWKTCAKKEEIINAAIGTAEVIRNMILRREG